MNPTTSPDWGKTHQCTCSDPLTAAVIKHVGGTISHETDCPEIADDLTARYNAMQRHTGEPMALNSDALANSVATAVGGTTTSTIE